MHVQMKGKTSICSFPIRFTQRCDWPVSINWSMEILLFKGSPPPPPKGRKKVFLSQPQPPPPPPPPPPPQQISEGLDPPLALIPRIYLKLCSSCGDTLPKQPYSSTLIDIRLCQAVG